MNADFLHRFVPGRSERTLLLLHGTGGTEDDLLPIGRTLDPEAALLSPRGKALENGMPRFFRRLSEGVFDEEDVVFRARELAGFLQKSAAHYGFDPKKLFAVGYSNGANIAGALLLLEPGSLGGAALLRPMVPLVPELPPRLDSLPVLIAAGRQDPIATETEASELSALLSSYGAEVHLALEDAGHGLTAQTIETTRHWLTTV